METMFGDQTAEDFSAGLSIFFGLDMSLNNEDMSLECSMDTDLATSETKGSLKGKMPPSVEGLSEIDVSIYSDVEYVYADLSSVLPEGTPAAAGKMKISNEEIVMMIMSLMEGMQNPGEPMNVEEGGDETVGGEDAMSLAAIVMMLDEMGVKFAMDTANDELKVKMSFTKEFMMGMMGAPVAEEGVDEIVDPFKEFVFDLYLHIDAQGQLVAFTAQIDIEREMPGYDENLQEITIKTSVSAVMAIRVTKGGNVELPADLNTYTLMPLEDLMGGMMG